MDPFDDIRREQDWLTPVFRIERAIAVAQPEDGLYAVAIEQLQVERTNDIVQTGRQPAAGHDRGARVAWTEVDLGSRPGLLQAGPFLLRRPDLLLDAQPDPQRI